MPRFAAEGWACPNICPNTLHATNEKATGGDLAGELWNLLTLLNRSTTVSQLGAAELAHTATQVQKSALRSDKCRFHAVPLRQSPTWMTTWNLWTTGSSPASTGGNSIALNYELDHFDNTLSSIFTSQADALTQLGKVGKSDGNACITDDGPERVTLDRGLLRMEDVKLLRTVRSGGMSTSNAYGVSACMQWQEARCGAVRSGSTPCYSHSLIEIFRVHAKLAYKDQVIRKSHALLRYTLPTQKGW
ncbi:uncharacterized protein MYCGRDRAFT_97669 [Zymoseptoria tritici IPO323]|uniref:Uncharacterized protein n=1 Tax=Zymoseptoria tritici (strain CBS 115943 / IPO323) TaxID=336722 RepID=F9XQY1_ZYMTI|nr:uncharacterized protein MYCGRDRAFT_97669 [Zymoseptoria tritici IPO323]EGP82311.1 hypothetical protein MYCGRDRAFT_97669 [Zymoseptoria tritici IPO323]